MAEGLKPVYLLYGDPSLVREFLEKLKKEALKGGSESFNYHSWSATSMDAEEVLQTALTMPVFGGKRLIVVKDCHQMKEKDRALFADYVTEPSVESCLVLVYGEESPSARDRLFGVSKKKGFVKELKSPTGRRLSDWIVRYVREEGKEITPQAVETLVEMRGDSLGELKAELDKLILYKGEDKRIDRADVEDTVLQAEEVNIFELTDAIGRKDRRAAMKAFSLLKDEEPLKVLGTLAWYVRLLVRCRELMEGGKEDLASRLRIPRFRVPAYRQAAARFSKKRLYRLLLLLSETDALLKGSQQKPEDVMFRLIVELCK